MFAVFAQRNPIIHEVRLRSRVVGALAEALASPFRLVPSQSMAMLEHEMADVQPSTTDLSVDVDLGATLGVYRHGAGDPTTWIERTRPGIAGSGRFVRATWTPDGPATVMIRWSPDTSLHAETWGPGKDWMLESVPGLIGECDTGAPHLTSVDHPVVAAACHARRHVRIGRSGTLYHELLPNILEQRITSGEAVRQWAQLCRELSEPAPGPFARLLLPPSPERLRSQPSWWFHPLGIERKRAEPLIDVARHANKMWEWADRTPEDAGRMLRLIKGIGVWTTGVTLGPALGDPDAVPVGDFHVKNIIGWNLAGEARATDERMLELLEPYAGQRGRVVKAVLSHGDGAPKYGPKQRILPMARW